MIRNIIFDFMGVIADIDYKKMLNSLSLTDKFKALRLFVKYKTSKELQDTFDAYQTGYIDIDTVDYLLTRENHSFNSFVYRLSDAVYNSITINQKMIKLIHDLKRDGFNIYLMSNSTPETVDVINAKGLNTMFDGMLLSSKVGVKKPSNTIFQLSQERLGCEPYKTFFIDDTEENRQTASRLGYRVLPCKKSTDAVQNVANYFYSNYNLNSDEQEK